MALAGAKVRRAWSLACVTFALLPVIGCSHHAQVAYAPPPSIANPSGYPQSQESQPAAPNPAVGEEQAPAGRPIYSEVGMASWYGPPYNKRRGANGQIYDENAITAANRTLPMGSLIRVTNLQTGQSAMMRITDRGPFVPDRVIDLSVSAAKLLGVWRPGTARVRIDVYEAPKPINQGGRWCVQIGAFSHAGAAKKLEEHLERKYESASVIEFTGPTGHWVRIRPENGDRSRAIEIANSLRPEEGEAYLVRLD
ncbi:MAG: septal ring lytic transglycosylase RlpA family protein [Silvibacterium sp.]